MGVRQVLTISISKMHKTVWALLLPAVDEKNLNICERTHYRKSEPTVEIINCVSSVFSAKRKLPSHNMDLQINKTKKC
jgi:hypothetical protein